VIKAAEEIGLGTTQDLVGPNMTGFTIAQTISRNGVRLSAPRAFLWPVRNRGNLHIALKAIATKVTTKSNDLEVQADGIIMTMVSRLAAVCISEIPHTRLYDDQYLNYASWTNLMFAERLILQHKGE